MDYDQRIEALETRVLALERARSKTARFVPPSFEEVEGYIKAKGYNVDANIFYEYFTEGNWIDSTGKKVRSWKQKAVMWNNSGYGKTNGIKKTKLFQIPGRNCSVKGCRMPAVYHVTDGDYDNYKCSDHMPEKVKEKFC